MTHYLKNILRLPLIVFLGVNFLLVPFYHFHPDSSHSHSGDVSPHSHAGHLHSAEMESFAHALNLHPADPELDARHHQSHSSTAHDADEFEISLQNTPVISKVTFQADSHSAVIALTVRAELDGFRSILYKTDSLENFNSPDTPNERSPPTRFI